jgi:hypothetical protein
VLRRFIGWAAFGCFLASCSGRVFPPNLSDIVDGGFHVPDSGVAPPKDGCVTTGTVAPSPDAQGLCGNAFLDVTSDPPNLYFVIDRSGSMGEIVEGLQKYDAVATAAVTLVRSLGSQANVGAAIFPGRAVDEDHPCATGEEVYPAQPGDPIQSSLCGSDGPVTRAFSRAISLPSGVRPNGATPTAASLTALLPTVAALRGRTVVLLATDGGPNCNPDAMCDANHCIPNIERQIGCSTATNCCDPSIYGPGSCLDEDGTKTAVANLFAKGIKTYVVGIPGSAPYATLLNELAAAGGTVRAGMPTSYYDVQHIAELDDVLATIGSTVTLSCQIHLAAPPPDSGYVNLYLDGQLVKYGPDGWTWGPLEPDAGSNGERDAQDEADGEPATEAAAPHTEIDLIGNACTMLTSGKYRKLQVVFGCPTDIPK